MDFGWGLSPGLLSPSPPPGQDPRGVRHIPLNGRGTNHRRRPADRTPLVGASALHGVSGTSPRSHLGSTLGSGKSCPDPGRLSTFGVSGLYPCRRLTYRGACSSILHGDPGLVKLLTQPPRLPGTHHRTCTQREISAGSSHCVHVRRWSSSSVPSKAWRILCRTPTSRRCSTGCTAKRRARCRCCAKGSASSTGR